MDLKREINIEVFFKDLFLRAISILKPLFARKNEFNKFKKISDCIGGGSYIPPPNLILPPPPVRPKKIVTGYYYSPENNISGSSYLPLCTTGVYLNIGTGKDPIFHPPFKLKTIKQDNLNKNIYEN